MFILRNWPAALLVFYWCLMSPLVFACEAILQKDVVQGFVERGFWARKIRMYSGSIRVTMCHIQPSCFPQRHHLIEKALYNRLQKV